MKRSIQVDDFRGHVPSMRNMDSPLTIYYDETNNIRRLSLSELGLNVPETKVFVIGGIALLPGQNIDNLDDLRKALRVQDNAGEIKLKHVAKGSYPEILAAKKLATFLDWLLANNIMIHYSTMDPLHWTILDIIESLMNTNRPDIIRMHIELKSELYYAMRVDLKASLSLLHSYHYPDVPRDRVSDFLNAVCELVENNAPNDRNFVTTALKRILRSAAKDLNTELMFLHDNQSGKLIDDFSAQFIHCTYMFKHATHIYDRETLIEGILDNFDICDGNRKLDYRFSDSKSELGIQLSDVITGVLGSHFSHLQDTPLPVLIEEKKKFSAVQRDNLKKIKLLIDRSDAYSEVLFHSILPLDTVFKNMAFLHDKEVPEHMYLQ